MIKDVLVNRLKEYHATNTLEQENALDQQGPWAGQKLCINAEWYLDAMKKRIESIDWPSARRDVERFAMSREQPSLELWTQGLFLQQLEQLAESLSAGS